MSNLPINATLNTAIEKVKKNIFATLNCHNIGRVVEYNAQNNTATIETMILNQWYDTIVEPSLIMDVPIITFGTKNARITMPNPVGCYVILLFMDKNIDNFLETGEQHLSPTSRTHSISDCVALLTVDSEIDEQPLYDENALTLSNKGIIEEEEHQTFIKVKPDTVSIANNKQNLSNLIDLFLQACEQIETETNTGILKPASKQKFTDLKAKFKELLS